MRDILNDAAGLGKDPVMASQKGMKPVLPRRFYSAAQAVASGAGYGVHLDGKPVRTPGRKPLELPTLAAAGLVASEFGAQGEHIDPATMPTTRLANSIVDGVTGNEAAVRADIVAYAGSDLVCYRAAAPRELVALEDTCWNPVVEWLRDRHGVNLVLAQGVMHVRQPDEAIAALGAMVGSFTEPFAVGSLHAITTLTGSAAIALAFGHGVLDCPQAWAAANVDEDWNVRQWGEDAEAADRRASRQAEMAAACELFMKSKT